MERAIAERVLAVAQECSRRIDRSVELAVETCTADEYAGYGRLAGKMMASIFENLMAPIYDEYPDLAPEWYNEMNRKRSRRSQKP